MKLKITSQKKITNDYFIVDMELQIKVPILQTTKKKSTNTHLNEV